jgi:hypothetical protein
MSDEEEFMGGDPIDPNFFYKGWGVYKLLIIIVSFINGLTLSLRTSFQL